MQGWLIVNAFLIADSFRETQQSLLAAASSLGVTLTLKTNAEVLCRMGGAYDVQELHKYETPDFALFWDKDVRLAAYLEKQEIKVYNSSRAIELCDDKSLMYACLDENDISIPKTILAPKTYANCGYNDYAWVTSVVDDLGFPLVLKECFGSWGEQVHLIPDESTLQNCLSKTASRPVLFQKFVEASFGRDVRVYVVGSRCEAALLRTSPLGTFLSNRMAGSQVQTYSLSKEEEIIALRSIDAMGLDFGSVDLFYEDKQNPLVCEVNSNIQFHALEQLEDVPAIAEKIIHHIADGIKGEDPRTCG